MGVLCICIVVYGQSVTTRRLRDCFIITNQRRWIWHEQKGCVLIRINVNGTKEKKLNMIERNKESYKKNMLIV